MMKKTILALALLLPSLAYAADIPVKAQPIATPAPATCTVNQCTTWYAGAGIFGSGSNVDILGQGLDNSVFANGVMAAGDIGYQYWYNGVFLGAEDILGYNFGSSSTVSNGSVNPSGGLDILWLEAGGSLGDFFGSGATPVALNAALTSDLITPYFGTGPAFAFGGTSLGTQEFWTTGAGVRYLLPSISHPIILDVKYVYGDNTNTSGLAANKNIQFVGATIDMPF